MFEAINPDLLLQLRLINPQENAADHKSRTYWRIAGFSISSDGEQGVLHLREDDGRETGDGAGQAVSERFSDAAGKYLVVRNPLKYSHNVTLRAFLSNVRDNLFRYWPKSLHDRQAVFEAWLADDGREQHLSDDARRWLFLARVCLQLEPVRTAASLTSSCDELFLVLQSGLERDRTVWTTAGTEQKGHWQTIAVNPGPNPVSLLPELNRAFNEYMMTAAAMPGGRIEFRLFLGQALERHWSRVVAESTLLREAVGASDAGMVRVTARIRGVKELSEPQYRIETDSRGMTLRIKVTFSERASTETNHFAAVLKVCSSRMNSRHQDNYKTLAAALEFYINDTLWSLTKFFHRNPLQYQTDKGMPVAEALEGWLVENSHATAEKITLLERFLRPINGVQATFRRKLAQWLPNGRKPR